jgi:predicted Zn-dependent protease
MLSPLFATEKKSLDDEQLRLMYDSFIFSKDLKHAYTIAKKALENNPKSLYWHKKMGEVALWTGHNDVAMEHLIYLYKHTNDEKLGDSIIKQMLATYQYKKALPLIKNKLVNHHDNHTIHEMIDINEKVGKPEESIKTLKKLYIKNPQAKTLASILALYLETGHIKQAKNIVVALEKYKNQSVKAALALSKYYFLQKDLQKAYQALLKVKAKAKKDNIKYFQHLSDLGWYLHDNNNAVYGSMMLYQAKQARLVDYERIQMLYKKKDIALMKDIALEAMKTHKSKKFLLNYADAAINKGHFETLNRLLNTELNDQENGALLEKDPKFWLLKAKVDEHFQKTDSMQDALQKALTLAPNSPNTTNTILWSLIDNSQYVPLDKLVKKIEQQKEPKNNISHALSAAYLTLQKPDKAMFYLNKALKKDPSDIDLKFLHTEILAAQGDFTKQRKILKEILKKLQTDSDKDPTLLKDPQFLRRYLQASLEFANNTQWYALLEAAKSHLKKRDYFELQILHALKHKNFKKAKELHAKSHIKNPQLEIELAHAEHNRKQESALLQHYALIAPKAILIEHSEEAYHISEAIAFNQEALLENSTNPYLIGKLQQLYNDYTHHYHVGSAYAKRGELKTLSFELYHFYYLAKGYGLITEIKDFEQSSTNLKQFNVGKSSDLHLHIGVKKTITDGHLQAGITYRNSQKTTIGVNLKVDKGITDSLRLLGTLENNARVEDQSIMMQVGGKQEKLTLQATYTLTENQLLSIMGEYNRYRAQDDTDIGHGLRANLTWDYTFLPSYSTGVRLFYNIGKFDEKSNKGSIAELLNNNQQHNKLLQNDYHDSGVGFYYGDAKKIFGKNFNPYIDIAAVYSGKEKRFYTLLETGFTGAFSKTDFYHLGVKYQNAINGIDQEELAMHLNYSQHY